MNSGHPTLIMTSKIRMIVREGRVSRELQQWLVEHGDPSNLVTRATNRALLHMYKRN
jgi:hypothetical protein